MLSTQALLIVTALLEFGAGLLLLVAPSFFAHVLLGEDLMSPPALVVARITGSALLTLGVVCWFERRGERRTQVGLVAGMLLYNLAVPIVLIHGWLAFALHGMGLWPASVVHALMALWCAVCLRPGRQESIKV